MDVDAPSGLTTAVGTSAGTIGVWVVLTRLIALVRGPKDKLAEAGQAARIAAEQRATEHAQAVELLNVLRETQGEQIRKLQERVSILEADLKKVHAERIAEVAAVRAEKHAAQNEATVLKFTLHSRDTRIAQLEAAMKQHGVPVPDALTDSLPPFRDLA